MAFFLLFSFAFFLFSTVWRTYHSTDPLDIAYVVLKLVAFDGIRDSSLCTDALLLEPYSCLSCLYRPFGYSSGSCGDTVLDV